VGKALGEKLGELTGAEVSCESQSLRVNNAQLWSSLAITNFLQRCFHLILAEILVHLPRKYSFHFIRNIAAAYTLQ
jgi:hypothetical protein